MNGSKCGTKLAKLFRLITGKLYETGLDFF